MHAYIHIGVSAPRLSLRDLSLEQPINGTAVKYSDYGVFIDINLKEK